MDGLVLAGGLMTLQGTDLRMIVALLCKTNIGHMLSSKTKNLFSKEEQDHFTVHLAHEVKRMEEIPDHQLQVDLFLEMKRPLKLRGMKYIDAKEIEDQCQIIIQDVYDQLMKQEKHFRAFVEKQSSYTQLQQMITYQMSKVFSEMDSSMQKFTAEDQNKFAAQVHAYIQELPEEKQQLVIEKLELHELTDEWVRHAIATNGTSYVFASIAAACGFEFYKTAASLIASYAGLLRLTLPFEVNTIGLAATIAVLENPLVMFNHQNKALKLLPIIVMQIALPFMESGKSEADYDAFIKEWESRYRHHQALHQDKRRITHERDIASAIVQERIERIQALQEQLAEQRLAMENIKQGVVNELRSSNVKQLSISPGFAAHVLEYMTVLEKIESLQAAKINQKAEPTFFEKLGHQFKKMTVSLDLHEEQKKLAPLLEKMAEEVVTASSSFMKDEREAYIALQEESTRLSGCKDEEEQERDKQQDIVKQCNEQLRSLEQQIAQFEKDHYGLSDLEITKPLEETG